MSVAYYIVLDIEEPGFEVFVNGKSLAHEGNLDALCQQLHLKTFEDYLSVADEVSGLFGEDIDFLEGEGGRWFLPEEGLAWVAALAAYIQTHPGAVTDSQGCIDDLAEYAEVFAKAKGVGAKWRLSLDI